ncbi:hypothetical protein DVZ84_21665 [Streptomyces parvulus]|uniref:Uncharacterized protein n=1 Tax=Streptomyces parvulus TaxID=146923 RepID=A0A369V960_9ACTN|nr:hypothetical protein DVZ84_21665 [Streptomyces parvulus]
MPLAGASGPRAVPPGPRSAPAVPTPRRRGPRRRPARAGPPCLECGLARFRGPDHRLAAVGGYTSRLGGAPPGVGSTGTWPPPGGRRQAAGANGPHITLPGSAGSSLIQNCSHSVANSGRPR